MFLNASGGVSFYLGNGKNYRPASLHSTEENLVKAGRWHHLAATWDGAEKTVWIDGKEAGRWPFQGTKGVVAPGSSPLRLAVSGEDGLADHFLDGDLARPVIYEQGLDSAQISARFNQQGLAPAAGQTVLPCWSFAEEIGSRVADGSRHKPPRTDHQSRHLDDWRSGLSTRRDALRRL